MDYDKKVLQEILNELLEKHSKLETEIEKSELLIKLLKDELYISKSINDDDLPF